MQHILDPIIDKHQHIHFFIQHYISLECWFHYNTSKYLKVLRHVSILMDHHQVVCLYLAKVTEYLKI